MFLINVGQVSRRLYFNLSCLLCLPVILVTVIGVGRLWFWSAPELAARHCWVKVVGAFWVLEFAKNFYVCLLTLKSLLERVSLTFADVVVVPSRLFAHVDCFNLGEFTVIVVDPSAVATEVLLEDFAAVFKSSRRDWWVVRGCLALSNPVSYLVFIFFLAHGSIINPSAIQIWDETVCAFAYRGAHSVSARRCHLQRRYWSNCFTSFGWI